MSGPGPFGTVVKIGGSLVADPLRLRAVLARLAEGCDGPAVIVSGGGPFADAVRTVQEALAFGEPLAHRLALDAMGRMAEVFREVEPRLRVVDSAQAAGDALAQNRIVVWSPADLRDGHPGIPESWDVTSDSLALWLATRLHAARCVLVKSAPGPTGAGPDAMGRSGLVDRAFPAFAMAFPGEIVVRSPAGDAAIPRVLDERSSSPRTRPEVRGAAEPRRSPPARAADPGDFLRSRFAAPRDECEDGIAMGHGPA